MPDPSAPVGADEPRSDDLDPEEMEQLSDEQLEALRAALAKYGLTVPDEDDGMGLSALIRGFQRASGMLVDGVLGAQGLGAMLRALGLLGDAGAASGQGLLQRCSAETWTAFESLRDLLVNTPVRYGPGRGLFQDGSWIITYGPGRLGAKSWSTKRNHTYPSFHCSSFTNFFLGWLLRYNERYTHSGNIPLLVKLCTQDSSLHEQESNPKLRKYRGYGEHCLRLAPNGTTAARLPRLGSYVEERALDAIEIHERRSELGTFNVWLQSTLNGAGKVERSWHHTGVFVVDHRDPARPMYRIAADGYKSKTQGYSGTAMEWTSFDAAAAEADAKKRIYQVFRVSPDDDKGNFGQGRPLCPVVLED
ncbi:peptidoglycan-binding domain-containing protein [Haliangium sp.]|uniref:peptidoglycan-binding domain-containing protein n=1 Tax=Haliangium sp. TaxID=2663208 RepID=UPI003D14ECE1